MMVCPVCNSETARVCYTLPAYRIAACDDCGLQFNADFPGSGDQDGVFSEHYYRQQHEAAFAAQFGDISTDPSFVVYRHWLEHIEVEFGVGRVLDVGAGLGAFLRLARARGWDAQGVEISRFGAEYARTRHGLEIFQGDIQQFPAPAQPFRLITFWDSLEHVRQPAANLLAARRLLTDDGLILISTDNFDCLVADIAVACYHLSVGRCCYPMRRTFIDRNVSFFTEKTFRALLQRVGLRVVQFQKMEYPLDKIQTSPWERCALMGLYAAARVLGRQAQFTVLAGKQ